MIALVLLALQQAADQPDHSSYWQQEVAYTITARLDEPSGVLSGAEQIHYRNRSPDTLSSFALHLYLNAFRPGSRWADADSVEGNRRFNDLVDPDYAFNHVGRVRIMGTAVEPIYPFAPDSTVVRFALPRALPPGDSMAVELEWDARPSTVPRRQGRQGRRFDFAQWYPKVVVYDRYGWEEHPLYPAGEFYGEFASFIVDLDVPQDQVIGATGVPVCGDPGWERANQNPSRPVEYQRDYYGSRTPSSDGCAAAAPGRKRVRWYAEDVHHFAMSLNPGYRYEGGRFGDVAVHVLYQPGDEASWGKGVAVDRTQKALAWLDQLYGKFAWPQITNVHRIEGGGTEFPMMIMDGSADQGLIVHELGHNYTMGMLANNEWREGWLDEGFTSFQTSWFWEAMGRPSAYPGGEAQILNLDLDQQTEPPSQVAETYRDFTSYQIAIYARGELFFHQLRYVVGDETMHRILQRFYQRWKLKHVDESAFRAVAEEVSHRDLSSLFSQWLHGTELYDFAVGRVRTQRTQRTERTERTQRRQRTHGAAYPSTSSASSASSASSEWLTRVEVVRKAPGRIPVDVAVIAEQDTGLVRANGEGDREWVEVRTRTRPSRVELDADVRTHDWNMLNNRSNIGFNWPRSFLPPPGTDFYFHRYFSTRSRRDRLTVGVQPTLWYNDAGGITLGARSRDDYLGRFEQNAALVSFSTGWGTEPDVRKVDFWLRGRNPVFLRSPNLSQTLDLFKVEGRYGLLLQLEREYQAHLTFGPTWTHALTLQWVHPDDFRYLDRGYYDDVGTVELQASTGVSQRVGRGSFSLRFSTGGGLAYNRAGLAASGRPNLNPFYYHGTLEAIGRRPLGRGWSGGARFFAGVSTGNHDAAKQRQIYFQGADPLTQLSNPFLRSRGALLVGEDFHYQTPGGASVRGIDSRVSTGAIIALNLELSRVLLTRPNARLFNRASLTVFGDLSQAIGGSAQPLTGDRIRFLGDAGVGLRIDHRIGDTRFVTRLDLPLYVSRPELAQDRNAGDDSVEFRWVFSFQPEL